MLVSLRSRAFTEDSGRGHTPASRVRRAARPSSVCVDAVHDLGRVGQPVPAVGWGPVGRLARRPGARPGFGDRPRRPRRRRPRSLATRSLSAAAAGASSGPRPTSSRRRASTAAAAWSTRAARPKPASSSPPPRRASTRPARRRLGRAHRRGRRDGPRQAARRRRPPRRRAAAPSTPACSGRVGNPQPKRGAVRPACVAGSITSSNRRRATTAWLCAAA